jgi:hypothetical protein
MSDQSDFPREMPPLVTAKPAGLTTFEYFSEHVVAISALTTLFVGLGSTCMLFGYVFALDRDLLRLVQYSDVLQFGLETIVFLGFGLALASLYGAAFRWSPLRKTFDRWRRPGRWRKATRKWGRSLERSLYSSFRLPLL